MQSGTMHEETHGRISMEKAMSTSTGWGRYCHASRFRRLLASVIYKYRHIVVIH